VGVEWRLRNKGGVVEEGNMEVCVLTDNGRKLE
jgi:hypothetical protein